MGAEAVGAEAAGIEAGLCRPKRFDPGLRGPGGHTPIQKKHSAGLSHRQGQLRSELMHRLHLCDRGAPSPQLLSQLLQQERRHTVIPPEGITNGDQQMAL